MIPDWMQISFDLELDTDINSMNKVVYQSSLHLYDSHFDILFNTISSSHCSDQHVLNCEMRGQYGLTMAASISLLLMDFNGTLQQDTIIVTCSPCGPH